jgi:hypothetical protein
MSTLLLLSPAARRVSLCSLLRQGTIEFSRIPSSDGQILEYIGRSRAARDNAVLRSRTSLVMVTARGLRAPVYLAPRHQARQRAWSASRQPSFSIDRTCEAGQLSPARTTRTRPPSLINTCEHTSLSTGTTVRSVSGRQSSVMSTSPGKICQVEPSSSSTTWLSECDRIFI